MLVKPFGEEIFATSPPKAPLVQLEAVFSVVLSLVTWEKRSESQLAPSSSRAVVGSSKVSCWCCGAAGQKRPAPLPLLSSCQGVRAEELSPLGEGQGLGERESRAPQRLESLLILLLSLPRGGVDGPLTGLACANTQK